VRAGSPGANTGAVVRTITRLRAAALLTMATKPPRRPVATQRSAGAAKGGPVLAHDITRYSRPSTSCGSPSEASLLYEKRDPARNCSGLNWYTATGPSLRRWYAPPATRLERARQLGCVSNTPAQPRIPPPLRGATHGSTTVSSALAATVRVRGAGSVPPSMVTVMG